MHRKKYRNNLLHRLTDQQINMEKRKHYFSSQIELLKWRRPAGHVRLASLFDPGPQEKKIKTIFLFKF